MALVSILMRSLQGSQDTEYNLIPLAMVASPKPAPPPPSRRLSRGTPPLTSGLCNVDRRIDDVGVAALALTRVTHGDFKVRIEPQPE